jgi:hypothetical protein
MSCICEPSTSVHASSSFCAGYGRTPSHAAATDARSAASASNSFLRFQRFMYPSDVIDPAECSVSCSSPWYDGSFARIAGVIALNIQSAGPETIRSGPFVCTLSSTFATERSVGPPPWSPVP